MGHRLVLWVIGVSLFAVPTACTSILGDFKTVEELGGPEAGALDAATDHSTDHGGTEDAHKDTSSTEDSPSTDAAEELLTGDASEDSGDGQSTALVKVTVSGSGTVTSVAAGISCPSKCSAEVDPSDVYSLTATPAAGSLFVGWTGACTGKTTCSVIPPSDVTATFATYATWDPTWSLAGVTYTDGNLAISYANAPQSTDVRTTIGKSTGAYYWEITATGGDGVTNAGGLGIAGSDMPNTAFYIGDVPSGLSFGYGTSNVEYWTDWVGVTLDGVPPANTAVTNGFVYMFALDMTKGNFWAGLNGTWFNGGIPATGVSPAATGITGTVYPAVTFYETPNSINSYTANFGASKFEYAVPTGFISGFY